MRPNRRIQAGTQGASRPATTQPRRPRTATQMTGPLNVTVGDLTYWPHYYSTYCIHGLHDQCRLTCKTCKQPCLCICHEKHPDEATGVGW